MKVIDPGHIYELNHIDPERPGVGRLTFIKRSSGAIEHPNEHPGTNVQEVLRALYYLRMALFLYEARAWRRKQQKLNRLGPGHEHSDDRMLASGAGWAFVA